MQFIVDTVTEFTFLENLLLGLADELHNQPGVRKTLVKRSPPISNAELVRWEKKNGVTLPKDLRNFYTSSNGFHFQWSYSFGGGDNAATCKVDVNALGELSQVYGYETSCEPGMKFENGQRNIKLAPDSKVFELSKISDIGRVVLVYLYTKRLPSIWILITPIDFYYLTDSIATYLLMAVVHLGIPSWQIKFTPSALPPWSESMFRMLAPHLLKFSENKLQTYESEFLNKLQPNLINVLPSASLSSDTPTTETTESSAKGKPKPKRTPRITPVHSKKDVKRPCSKYKRKPLYYIKKR